MRVRAKARRPKPGSMNRTEKRYAERLETLRLAGEVASYHFEPLKLKLAKSTFYMPDFMVILPNGEVEFVDVKGRKGSGPGGWEDDARVKIKCAAERFPMFRFVGAHPDPKVGWVEESFG